MQDSLPAAGPALPGGIGYPQGSWKGFTVVTILLSRAFWRDVSYHYCFPCIKSISWIHGKTSKTDRR